MPSELYIEVYKQHRAAQEKYVYFLLAAVGAAIALAVNQTQGTKLAYSQIPLAIAVVLWALSFFFGCKRLSYVQSTLYENAKLLRVQSGEHPLAGRDPQRILAASEGIRTAMDSNSTWVSRFARWQFQSLVAGAVFYLGWHVFEMWLRK